MKNLSSTSNIKNRSQKGAYFLLNIDFFLGGPSRRIKNHNFPVHRFLYSIDSEKHNFNIYYNIYLYYKLPACWYP